MVVKQNVHTKQDEFLLQRKCQTTIASATCASTLSLLATQRFFSFITILNLYLSTNEKLMNPKAQDISPSWPGCGSNGSSKKTRKIVQVLHFSLMTC
jgi:hypothetical protein